LDSRSFFRELSGKKIKSVYFKEGKGFSVIPSILQGSTKIAI
jgi:hypothetical protein